MSETGILGLANISNVNNNRIKNSFGTFNSVNFSTDSTYDSVDFFDIDAAQKENPLIVPEYAAEIYEFNFDMEKKYMWDVNYLEKQSEVTGSQRAILISWMMECSYKFRHSPETIFRAVNYVDRYLSKNLVLIRKLQLVGTAALFISAKIEERRTPASREYVKIAANSFTREELLAMERSILRDLDYDVYVPSAHTFLRRFTRGDSADSTTKYLSHYLINLSLVDHRLLNMYPSQVAAAAIYISNELNNRPAWTNNLRHYSNGIDITDSTLSQGVERLRILLGRASSGSRTLAPIYKKFASASYRSVADRFKNVV
eukprot:TRINITY_DN2566_c0_g2_i1.p1 TRINITY_DN2566_c0_g2~~TRINITY_DN2566_c0_g2_i1.p1  ORF type:complete len:327 (-),score=88.58 TRINITY_DN2566_c0_g2_i1:3-947(-)